VQSAFAFARYAAFVNDAGVDGVAVDGVDADDAGRVDGAVDFDELLLHDAATTRTIATSVSRRMDIA
jgi:hypothetical protein